MLRHIAEKHPGGDPEKIEFKMRVLTNHKSAFERQTREAVMTEQFAFCLVKIANPILLADFKHFFAIFMLKNFPEEYSNVLGVTKRQCKSLILLFKPGNLVNVQVFQKNCKKI